MSILFKKSLISILILSLVLPVSFLSLPKKAEAIVPVMELGEQLQLVKGLHAKEVGQGVFGVPIGTSWDAIAWYAAKILLRGMTNNIINWIQTGNFGGPLFVTDILGYMTSVADNATGLYLEKILDPEIFNLLCTPFRMPLFNSLRNVIRPPDFPRARCTLSDIVRNMDNFFRGGFLTGGGYPAWLSLIQPQNNFYGSYLRATSDLFSLQLAKTQEAQSELSFGQGFISVKKQVPTGERKCVRYDNHGVCEEWAPVVREVIVTPGKAVEDHLADAFGSEIRQLELADEMNEIIAALISQLISTILRGPSGIIGYNRPDVFFPGGTGALNAPEASPLDTFPRETQQKLVEIASNQAIPPENDYLRIKEEEKPIAESVISAQKEVVKCLESKNAEADEVTKAKEKQSQLEQRLAGINQKIAEAKAQFDALNNLRTRILNASTIGELQVLAAELDSYKDKIHSPVQAQADLNLSKQELSDIQNSLKECQARPVRIITL